MPNKKCDMEDGESSPSLVDEELVENYASTEHRGDRSTQSGEQSREQERNELSELLPRGSPLIEDEDPKDAPEHY